MKLVIVLLAVVATSYAEFAQQATPVPFKRYSDVRDSFGQYSIGFETGDGVGVADQGLLKPGPEGHVLVRQGSHSYTAPDGTPIQLTYVADENGYQPSGAHLPKPVENPTN